MLFREFLTPSRALSYYPLMTWENYELNDISINIIDLLKNHAIETILLEYGNFNIDSYGETVLDEYLRVDIFSLFPTLVQKLKLRGLKDIEQLTSIVETTTREIVENIQRDGVNEGNITNTQNITDISNSNGYIKVDNETISNFSENSVKIEELESIVTKNNEIILDSNISDITTSNIVDIQTINNNISDITTSNTEDIQTTNSNISDITTINTEDIQTGENTTTQEGTVIQNINEKSTLEGEVTQSGENTNLQQLSNNSSNSNTNIQSPTGSRNVTLTHNMPEQAIAGAGNFSIDSNGAPILTGTFTQNAIQNFTSNNQIQNTVTGTSNSSNEGNNKYTLNTTDSTNQTQENTGDNTTNSDSTTILSLNTNTTNNQESEKTVENTSNTNNTNMQESEKTIENITNTNSTNNQESEKTIENITNTNENMNSTTINKNNINSTINNDLSNESHSNTNTIDESNKTQNSLGNTLSSNVDEENTNRVFTETIRKVKDNPADLVDLSSILDMVENLNAFKWWINQFSWIVGII